MTAHGSDSAIWVHLLAITANVANQCPLYTSYRRLQHLGAPAGSHSTTLASHLTKKKQKKKNWRLHHIGAPARGSVLCKSHLQLFSFPLPLPLLLPAPLPKTFGRSFLGACLGSFFGAFGGEFSFAFVFALNVERRTIGELPFAFTLGSTGR